MSDSNNLVTKEEIMSAYDVLKSVVRHTPLQNDQYLSQKYDCDVYLKREDLQRVRSFKLRGAYYAIKQLPEEQLKNGVVCASAGNHAQGVAYTANEMKIPAVIFMPTTTPQQKITQVKFFGGDHVQVELVGDTFDASAEAARRFSDEHHISFIEPFNSKNVSAGQGTLAVEIFNDLNNVEQKQADILFAPIGGGGLISGVAAYTKAVSPMTKVIGIEPTGAASMQLSILADEVVPLATVDKFVDGTAVKEVGDINFANVKKFVDEIDIVDEGLVCTTILELYSKLAIVAEPAGALTISALETHKDEIKGKTVICVVSGGNNDINRMQEIEERSLVYEGFQHYFVINFPQRPGALREFVSDILGPNDDITKFEYTKKVNRGSGPVVIGVRLKNKEDYPALVAKMTKFDPKFIDLSENQSLYTLLV